MSPDPSAGPPWRKEAEAHKRAMPLQRLLGNGMDYADAVELYRLADSGTPWADAGATLGEADVQRAEEAMNAGHLVTARSWYLSAAACFRVGQVPLPDTRQKRSLYRKLIDIYAAAGQLFNPPAEHVGIPWGGGTLWGWLLRPAGAVAPATVIVMGGFDGWREEYHVGATYLVDRGIAVLLIDGPGQGETRLFGGLVMDKNVTHAFAAMIDYLSADPRLGSQVGIWGNSMGGYLAAATAAADPRVAACCVNGGTVRPAEFPERFPRMIAKVEPLLGITDPGAALDALRGHQLHPTDLAQLHCPLLVLHGTPDQVFLVQNARALFDQAASTDKTWHEWPDGDHCIYNHSLEKHTIVGDWFADRLSGDQP